MKKKKEIIKGAAIPVTLDILGYFGVPTATGQHFYQKSMQKRVEAAREILLSEIKEGNFNNVDRDEAVSIAERYQRCAIEGVAKQNLRLLARIIRGMVDKNELTAPLFIKYSDALASLTEEEIHHLGQLSRTTHKSYPLDKQLMLIDSGVNNSERVYQSLTRTGLVRFTTKVDSSLNLNFPTDGYKKGSGRKNDSVKTRVINIYIATSMLREILAYAELFSDEDLAE